jgi:hypothetical protein
MRSFEPLLAIAIGGVYITRYKTYWTFSSSRTTLERQMILGLALSSWLAYGGLCLALCRAAAYGDTGSTLE